MIEELKARIADVLMRDVFHGTSHEPVGDSAPEWVQSTLRAACELQAENIVAAIGLDIESMFAQIDGETVEFIRFVSEWEQHGPR